MAGFDLSFEVISSQMKLDEISNLLGISCSEDSRETGAPIPGRRKLVIAEVTEWRLFSEADRDATLEEHFEDLLEKLRPAKILPEDLRAALAEDCKLRFSLAVFYEVEEEDYLFELRPDILREINRYDADLEVCLY